MSSFCLGEIYEKNQSGAERLLLFYLKFINLYENYNLFK